MALLFNLRVARSAGPTICFIVIGLACHAIGATALPARISNQPDLPPLLAQHDAQTQFALKDGDRVVFYGDSITEQRLYTTYVEHYCTTHYPDRRITFINTGWGGDKVTANDCQPCAGVGGLARIKRD